MAHDTALAARIRKALAAAPGVSDKHMFGGVAFLRQGLMFAGVVGSSLMCRVGKELYADALAHEDVREMDFTGKPMVGYVYVDEPGIATEQDLMFWLNRSLNFVATLPPKPVKTVRAVRAAGTVKAAKQAKPRGLT